MEHLGTKSRTGIRQPENTQRHEGAGNPIFREGLRCATEAYLYGLGQVGGSIGIDSGWSSLLRVWVDRCCVLLR